MPADQAFDRLCVLLAHLWMIRTFLKHADDIQGDDDLVDVPRTLYDAIRAVEPAREARDVAKFLDRLEAKMGKLDRAAETFAEHYRRASAHTNFEMCALSLSGCVRHMNEVFAALRAGPPAHSVVAADTPTRPGPK